MTKTRIDSHETIHEYASSENVLRLPNIMKAYDQTTEGTEMTSKHQITNGRSAAEHRSNTSRQSTRRLRRVFLTACTMVKNEAPYILEWIEFSRMQGFDRIIIYDHKSVDNVMMLNEFYREHAPGSHIHVLKSLELQPWHVEENLQELNFQHCLETYGNATEWMVGFDVDEFMYSPAFGTVADMLRNTSALARRQGVPPPTFVTSDNLNFGSSGQRHRFENRLERSADGRVRYLNPCGLQLITDHVRRGLSPLVAGEEAAYEEMVGGAAAWICRLEGMFSPCRHNPGKSVFRPPAVELAGVHHPRRFRTEALTLYSAPPLLVGNHYYYRSRADVELKAAQWRDGKGLPEHARNFNLTDARFWGRLEDRALRERFGGALLRRMRRLVTTEGARACLHGAGRGAA